MNQTPSSASYSSRIPSSRCCTAATTGDPDGGWIIGGVVDDRIGGRGSMSAVGTDRLPLALPAFGCKRYIIASAEHCINRAAERRTLQEVCQLVVVPQQRALHGLRRLAAVGGGCATASGGWSAAAN
jgi:hypothetical protein